MVVFFTATEAGFAERQALVTEPLVQQPTCSQRPGTRMRQRSSIGAALPSAGSQTVSKLCAWLPWRAGSIRARQPTALAFGFAAPVR